MKKLKKPPKGFRWEKIILADGERVTILTTDMRTKKGKYLFKKAIQIANRGW